MSSGHTNEQRTTRIGRAWSRKSALARASLVLVPVTIVAGILVIVTSVGGHAGKSATGTAVTGTTLAPTAACAQFMSNWALQLDETNGGALADADTDYGSENAVTQQIVQAWEAMLRFKPRYGEATALVMAAPTFQQICQSLVSANQWPPNNRLPASAPAPTTLPSAGLPPGYNPDNGGAAATTVDGGTAAAAPPAAFATANFANRTYDISCGNGPTVRLTDGSWTNPEGPDYGAIEEFDVVYGGAESNGVEDALVYLDCSVGISTDSGYTTVFKPGPDGPVQVGQVISGYSPMLEPGGGFTTYTNVYGPNDPMCCPSNEDHDYWSFEHGQWVLARSIEEPSPTTTGSTP